MPVEIGSRRKLPRPRMGDRVGWLFGLALLSSACTDPLVGKECAKGFEPCKSRCVRAGTCAALDGGIDSGHIEAGTTEAESEVGTDETAVDSDESSVDADETSIDAEDPLDGEADGALPAPKLDASRDKPGAEAKTDTRAVVRDTALSQLDVPPDLAPGPDLRDVARDRAASPQPESSVVPILGDEALDVPQGADTSPTLPADAAAPDLLDALPDEACVTCDAADAAPDLVENPDTIDAQDSQDADVTSDLPIVCPDAQIPCSGTCTNQSSDPQNCGTCGTVCSSGLCNQGVCMACGRLWETACSGVCKNLGNDPENCGTCGTLCATGLCNEGHCEAAGSGRVILIGHDFIEYRPQTLFILGNAVFLWPTSPVRLLVYEGSADQKSIARADVAISNRAIDRRKEYVRTIATASGLPAALANSDVLLIFGQPDASNATLLQLGKDWESALRAFVDRGGTVILLDGFYAKNAGTYQILRQASLISITGHSNATAAGCLVIGRQNALVVGFNDDYVCPQNSVRFASNEVAAVIQTSSQSVVIHKVF